MTAQPQIPHPDTIEPQSPPETPTPAEPNEAPMREPPEITPQQPDIDEPGRGPDEMPAIDGDSSSEPDELGLSSRGSGDIGQGGVLQSNLDQPVGGSVE